MLETLREKSALSLINRLQGVDSGLAHGSYIICEVRYKKMEQRRQLERDVVASKLWEQREIQGLSGRKHADKMHRPILHTRGPLVGLLKTLQIFHLPKHFIWTDSLTPPPKITSGIWTTSVTRSHWDASAVHLTTVTALVCAKQDFSLHSFPWNEVIPPL